MPEELMKQRSVTTTFSLPLSLYIRLIAKARTEGVSFSQVVREALYTMLEEKEEQKDLKGK